MNKKFSIITLYLVLFSILAIGCGGATGKKGKDKHKIKYIDGEPQLTEEAKNDFVEAADHFQPWVPQQGQSNLRDRVIVRFWAAKESIIQSLPYIGVPQPERILIASSAAKAPMADEMAPTTGKNSSKAGSSG